jgi:glyoxylase-like metal-dependent hydrolase (beta-lactamase superfamily II)
MIEVAPGIRQLTNGISNWYLVDEGGSVTLVDAGKPADWAQLLAALRTLGRTVDAVDSVLLTHAHSDHTGFAERARAEAGATARVHVADAAAAKGGKLGKHEAGMGRYLLRVEAYRTLFGLMRGGGLRIVPLTEVATFADDEVLDIPGHPRVIHTPGHTQGSAALWFEKSSAVCTGDALVLRNPMTGRRGPQVMPDGLNVSSQQALDSLERLERSEAANVLPGHGDVWTEGIASATRAARVAGRS